MSVTRWRAEINLCNKSLSCVQLFATSWTLAHQAPLSMGFSRQEYWSGLPFPSPGDLPNPRIKPRSPVLQVILYCLSYQGSATPPTPHHYPLQAGASQSESRHFWCWCSMPRPLSTAQGAHQEAEIPGTPFLLWGGCRGGSTVHQN